MSWENTLQRLADSLPSEIEAAASPESLEELRVRVLGRKGELTELLRSLKDLPVEERRLLGSRSNALKTELESLFERRSETLRTAALEAGLGIASIDRSLPGAPLPSGHLHPLTLTLRRMTRQLERLGFAWADGPLVETDYFNFEALNIPPEHPARDLQDTLYARLPCEPSKYIPGPHPRGASAALMRTHTSPVQIRSMLRHSPRGLPLRIMAPGRVFRHEAVDATHSAVFHQVEGLYVDRKVSLADLKGTLEIFIKGIFGPGTRSRFLPSYFPFVEPGVEVHVSCPFCAQSPDCGVCKGTGYLEMLGAGLVHPNVLKCGGYDPAKWSGYAFGIGVERVAMFLFGVSDIRTFYENDLRFLEQF